MILPTKRLSRDRALLQVGAEILGLLNEQKTVSRTWGELKAERGAKPECALVTYDWFVLALDLLFALRAIEMEGGRLQRRIR